MSQGEQAAHFTGAGRRLDSDDLIAIFSCSKVIESTVIGMAVDRGLLSYEAPIAQYWKEFARRGKGSITVAQLMRHQSGLPVLSEPIPAAMLQEGQEAQLDALLEDTELVWEPEVSAEWPRQVYHALTRGIIASALFRRVDPKRRSISAFFREEVAVPRGLNITLGGHNVSSDSPRVSQLEPPRMWLQVYKQAIQLPLWWLSHSTRIKLVGEFEAMLPFEYNSIAAWLRQAWRQQWLPVWIRGLLFAITGAPSLSPSSVANDPAFLAATELPSANGLANARSLALLGSALAGSGVVGTQEADRILSAQGLRAALAPGPASVEEFLGFNISFTAAGWGVGRFAENRGGIEGYFGWAGVTGALFQFNPTTHVSFAYIPTFPHARIHKPAGIRALRAAQAAAPNHTARA